MKALIDAWTSSIECRVCKIRKHFDSYHTNKVCKFQRTRTCRECAADKRRQWYKDNSDKRKAAANKRNQERRDECIAELGGKCFDCGGEFHRSVYDFHHRDPAEKVDAISNLLRSPDKLKEELKKCDLLCANCHRIRHFEEGN